MVRRRRRRPLQPRHYFSCLAALAFPERDLALLRAAGRGLPLYRRARSGFAVTPKQERGLTMQVAGKIVVVTGGANGIGRALCETFHRAGAARVIVADLNAPRAEAVAGSIDGAAFTIDVGREHEIEHLIEQTELRFGPSSLCCSS